MKKQFWIIILLFVMLLPVVGQGQWRISSSSGNERIGVIIEKDETILSLKTLDNQTFIVRRDEIESMEKLGSRIETISGKIYIGFISFLDDKTVVFLSESTGEIEINRAKIIKMDVVENIRQVQAEKEKAVNHALAKNSSQKQEIKPKETYLMLGATAFVRGGVNIVVGGQGKRAGLRLSATILDNIAGAQINILKRLYHDQQREVNFSFGLGYEKKFVMRDDIYNKGNVYTKAAQIYFGAFFDFNVSGFFGEIGFCAINEEEMYAKVFFQLGYIIRFN